MFFKYFNKILKKFNESFLDCFNIFIAKINEKYKIHVLCEHCAKNKVRQQCERI